MDMRPNKEGKSFEKNRAKEKRRHDIMIRTECLKVRRKRTDSLMGIPHGPSPGSETMGEVPERIVEEST